MDRLWFLRFSHEAIIGGWASNFQGARRRAGFATAVSFMIPAFAALTRAKSVNSFDPNGSPCFPSKLENCWGVGDVILEWMFPRAVGFFLRGQTVSQARTRKCWMNLQHNCWANQCQAWKFYGGPWWHVGWYFRHWVVHRRRGYCSRA
jgi:hypothetical protein